MSSKFITIILTLARHLKARSCSLLPGILVKARSLIIQIQSKLSVNNQGQGQVLSLPRMKGNSERNGNGYIITIYPRLIGEMALSSQKMKPMNSTGVAVPVATARRVIVAMVASVSAALTAVATVCLHGVLESFLITRQRISSSLQECSLHTTGRVMQLALKLNFLPASESCWAKWNDSSLSFNPTSNGPGWNEAVKSVQ